MSIYNTPEQIEITFYKEDTQVGSWNIFFLYWVAGDGWEILEADRQ